MKRKYLIGLVSLLLLLSIACGKRAAVNTPNSAPSVAAPAGAERSVVTYEGEDGRTALDLLKLRASIRSTTKGGGEIIEEINGVAAGPSSELVMFVNGERAKETASKYVTRQGDKIEWKLVGLRK